MSARHLQKHTQVNFQDGRLGTALLVTLAMNEPAHALDIEPHIPSDSYTGPPPEEATSTPSLNLLDSEEMLRSDPSTSDWRRWVALGIGCSLQICQTDLVDGNGPPLRHRKLGELYTPAEIQASEDSKAYPELEVKNKRPHARVYDYTIRDVQRIVKHLLDVQRGTQAAEWNEYKTKHQLQTACSDIRENIHQDFHAAQWLFTNATPEFFAEHRSEFGDLSRLLVHWTSGVILNSVAHNIITALPYLTHVIDIGNLKPWMLEECDRLNAFFKDRHHSKSLDAK
eukprot:Blabericola_migrator_1__5843@NODE_295_length_10235_cov_141_552026_g242_i0_p5_GENE_NODE_295_length_10235_cov_141_552026_g242_i0NODE_295_length_10235_cov_141_552026_g242_i0_p5_ORF_typecomplete_len283_score35_01FGGY_N/PF00370_21/0_14_NODE_295_length_10235_cov_141_552026_g242_i01691017